MKKIAIIPGSFNPFHKGHLNLGVIIKELEDFDEIFYLISPNNPFKNEKDLLNIDSRIKILELSIKNHDNFKICDYELRLPKPSYTYRTMKVLEEQFPNTEFTICLGSDAYNSITKWKKFDYLKKFSYIAIVRDKEKIDPNIKKIIETSEIISNNSLSSTLIRNNIKKNNDYSGLVNKDVEKHIKIHNLYE